MLLHLTQNRHIERACERHGLVLLLPDTLRCPRGHHCSVWLVVLVVGCHVYPFPSAPFDGGLSVLAGRDEDGYTSALAGRIRKAKLASAAGAAAATEARRNHNREKTHCRRGHEYTEGNTRLYMGAKGTPWRACWTCWNATMRASNARKRAAYKAARHVPVPA